MGSKVLCVDVSDEVAADVAGRVTQVALSAARSEATKQMLAAFREAGISFDGASADPERIAECLVEQDARDPLFDALRPYAAKWELLVVRFAGLAASAGRGVDAAAVAAARRSGLSWSAIADALGVPTQTAYSRYGPRAEGSNKPARRPKGD